MKIYTRGGDKGETGLVGGVRTPKNSARIEAIGDVDELNASIGVAICSAQENSLRDELFAIQNWLFELGAELAGAPGPARITAARTEALEKSIDRQTEQLESLRNFILPGGSPLAANLHLSRCVCRRAERAVIELGKSAEISDEALKFLNRLSDWLFVSARTANRLAAVEDIKWVGH